MNVQGDVQLQKNEQPCPWQPEALASAILHKPMPSWAALNAAGNQTKTGSQVVSLHHVASHRAETAVHKIALSQSWGKMLK